VPENVRIRELWTGEAGDVLLLNLAELRKPRFPPDLDVRLLGVVITRSIGVEDPFGDLQKLV